ncbi:hypothetical protein NC653_018184 [Populus alba x Populus x berolinensis]|uniref:Uncharacterized protein n=1 Tax=Populus alba x Populus x berolinensis TaxID=444605 RepID=A0AAD6VUP7_9ROSI|nr:hypothetical protein NC653_018184 [Populus alba x Populus x berolinensis]
MQLSIQPKSTHQVKPQLNKANLSNGSIGFCSRMIFSGKLQMAEGVVGNWDEGHKKATGFSVELGATFGHQGLMIPLRGAHWDSQALKVNSSAHGSTKKIIPKRLACVKKKERERFCNLRIASKERRLENLGGEDGPLMSLEEATIPSPPPSTLLFSLAPLSILTA